MQNDFGIKDAMFDRAGIGLSMQRPSNSYRSPGAGTTVTASLGSGRAESPDRNTPPMPPVHSATGR